MSGENETKTEITETEMTAVKENIENEIENKEEKTTQEEFVSEFAPEPIKIPKYNKEKEMRKVEKAKEKKRKSKTKKSRKRKKLLRRIVLVARSIVLFILLVSVVSATLSSLLVKMNTTEYSIETAIRSHNPETFVVGKIKNPSKINLKTSSQKASVADVIRDNSMITVTYADIKQAVTKSTYPGYIAKVAHNVVNHYIFGKTFNGVTSTDISKMLLENVSYIKLVTGVELGQSACKDIGRYAAKSETIKSLSAENLEKQPAAKYTEITSVAFSTMILLCLIIALALLIVLTVIGCKGFAHKMIGWASIVSGIIIAVAGMLFKPTFVSSSKFINCIIDAITKSFNQSALIYAAIAFLIGILAMLIGKAMADDDDDEYDEDYIDEIEQISTAQ